MFEQQTFAREFTIPNADFASLVSAIEQLIPGLEPDWAEWQDTPSGRVWNLTFNADGFGDHDEFVTIRACPARQIGSSFMEVECWARNDDFFPDFDDYWFDSQMIAPLDNFMDNVWNQARFFNGVEF